MDTPASGDIFPAVQAIRMIDEVDLTPPIEVPPISQDAYPENMPAEEHRWLEAEIRRLKKERKAYILAHNYAPSDIQDVADAVGDSLYLAQKGAGSDADILLEASVLFMNQILAIMKKPHQRVLAPDLGRSARWPPMRMPKRFASGSGLIPTASLSATLTPIWTLRLRATIAARRPMPRRSSFMYWPIPINNNRFFSFPMFIWVFTLPSSWSSKISRWSDYGS
jgi:hypothetical protein